MVDNFRELSLTSTSKGVLYKCIGNIDGKNVFCIKYLLRTRYNHLVERGIL